ncbi:MAG: type II toxin-antitoxin system prevent-host-death family antitoxin [Mycobacteriales bacterium]
MATTIPQRQLRNDVSAVLRRVEAGEEFVVTVSGRPVAELRPVEARRPGSVAAFVAGLAERPPPTPAAVAALQRVDEQIREMRSDGADDDPWTSP